MHGLGGGDETWGCTLDLIKKDSNIDATCYLWKYPSPTLGLKFTKFLQKNYLGIHDLADALKTYIDEAHVAADEIVLVGHSMGGLVIRQYLLNNNARRVASKIKQTVLYAVPNTGSELAAVTNWFSLFKNPHLLNLKKGSAYLVDLNRNWHVSEIEEIVDFTVVVGGDDRIVTAESARGTFRYANLRTIPEVGHLSICKPLDCNSLAYTILKNALLKKRLLKSFALLEADSFTDWQEYPKERIFEFQIDDARKRIFDGLSAELESTQSTIRIKGQSGLGKTRLVYECILAANKSIQDKVAYFNAASKSQHLTPALKQAIKQGFEGIFIVDNCKPELHSELAREVLKDSSRVLLITIDHSLDKLSSSHGKEWVVGRMAAEKIKAMLQPEFGDKIPDLERIAVFAQGFPKMAYLISLARLANEPDLGMLNDDELAGKLLGQLSADQEKILKSCALFDLFGFEGEVDFQYKFIAENIAFVTNAEFYTCIKQFEEKGLIDKSGRYSQLVPKPLAVRLASKWWTQTSQEDQQAIIAAIPQPMIKLFCAQVKMLGFLPEVKDLTSKLCGTTAPFGQAEVILSDRGSLLFRSFVEVNPQATATAIYQVLNSLDNPQLRLIVGNVRRNLVWALEKLIFHASTFVESAWCMFLLATSENETWSNNATGMFSQCFDVHLSGTEANFSMRLDILNKAIALNNVQAEGVVIVAIEHAIASYGSSRTVGAEFQSNLPPLQEYRPKIWQEIFDYWQSCIDILITIVEKHNENSTRAADVIGQSIRSMMSNGRVEMLDDAINRIVAAQGVYWPSALSSIQSTLKYDAENMPDLGVDSLNKWLIVLNPPAASIEDKLRILVIHPPWDHRKNDEGHYVDFAAENAMSLAHSISSQIVLSDDHLKMLLIGDQMKTFSFGKAWIESIDNEEELIERVINQIQAIKSPNFSLLLGMLQGLYTKSEQSWNNYLKRFATEPNLQQIYPFVIRTGVLTTDHINQLLELIISGVLPPFSATSLSNGGILSQLPSKVVSDFCIALSEINPAARWAALDVMFMYCYGSEKFTENELTLKHLALIVPLNQMKRSNFSDMYHWNEIIERFLNPENFEFAKAVCIQILSAASEKLSFSDLHDSIKPTMRKILQLFGDRLWPIFGESILKNKKRYSWITSLFSKEDNPASNKTSPLNYFPIDDLINWAKTDLDFSPYFLARSISIFDTNAKGEKAASNLLIKLLENFGDLPHFRGELNANISTRGWTGSLIPYLESDRNALEPLLKHHNLHVKEWAKEHLKYIQKTIEYEFERDAEHAAGLW